TDFAKEALFNILNHRISFSETKFLELFAGTGNISFEMASRGAKDLTAVDSDFGCVKFIQKISDELDFGIQPIKSDVYSFLEKNRQTFDVIFADPPYDFTIDQFNKICTAIFENNLLNPDGFLIIEHSKHTDLSSIEYFSEARKYGGSMFSFFHIS